MDTPQEKTLFMQRSILMLTFSKCPIEPSRILEALEQAFETLGAPARQEYIIAQEKHKDDTDHIHAYFKFQKKWRKRGISSRAFDVDGHHPNISPNTNRHNVIKYCTKEDNYISSFTPEELKRITSAKRCHKVSFNNDVLSCKNIRELTKLHVDQGRSLRSVLPLMQLKDALSIFDTYKDKQFLGPYLDNPWGMRIQCVTSFKQCHHWIYSKTPNRGKTTWAKWLQSTFRVYRYNSQEVFQDTFDPSAQIILFDEFKEANKLPIARLNEICDGEYKFPRKGMAAQRTERKPIVIVLSNYSIEESYKRKDTESLEAWVTRLNLLQARFEESDITRQPVDLFESFMLRNSLNHTMEVDKLPSFIPGANLNPFEKQTSQFKSVKTN